MSTAQIIMLATVIGYLIFMLIVGFVCSKKNNSVSDFYLGGRKLGPLVTAMSAEASDMSSWLLMGLPGLALLSGIADVSWTVIGLAVGTYLNWLIVAKRLRNYSAKIGAITIPDYFSLRYKDEKRILMAVSALIIIIFLFRCTLYSKLLTIYRYTKLIFRIPSSSHLNYTALIFLIIENIHRRKCLLEAESRRIHQIIKI